jgi:hypothetical protein
MHVLHCTDCSFVVGTVTLQAVTSKPWQYFVAALTVDIIIMLAIWVSCTHSISCYSQQDMHISLLGYCLALGNAVSSSAVVRSSCSYTA